MGGRRAERALVRHARDARVARAQQLVGAVLDPAGHVGVGGPAVGRVVLEAAVLRRVVRRGHHDAVRLVRGAAPVVDQDRVRDDRRRRDAVFPLDDGLHLIRGQDLERGALGRSGHRVGVLAHVQRPVDAAAAPVLADRLGGGQDVRLGEGAAQRGAAVPAGAEGDELVRVAGVGAARVVLALERADVHQHLRRRRLPRERRDAHGPPAAGRGPLQSASSEATRWCASAWSSARMTSRAIVSYQSATSAG